MPKSPTFLLGFALLWPTTLWAEAAGGSVAVVDAMTLAPKVPNAHERMRAVLAAALAAKGWTVVEVAGEECDHACLVALLQRTGARYVLRLAGDRNQDDGYDLVIELFRPGAAARRRTNAYCDYCNVERMAEVAGRTASGMLAAAALAGEAPARRKDAPARAPSPIPPPVVAQPSPRPRLAAPPPPPHGVAAWGPWALMGAGAVGLGYGVWALYRDDEATGNCAIGVTTTCQRYASKTLGIVTLAGGGLLVAGGLVWRIARPSSEASLSVATNHVAFHLRF